MLRKFEAEVSEKIRKLSLTSKKYFLIKKNIVYSFSFTNRVMSALSSQDFRSRYLYGWPHIYDNDRSAESCRYIVHNG